MRILHNEELRFLVPPNVIRMIKSRKMSWAGNVTCVQGGKNAWGDVKERDRLKDIGMDVRLWNGFIWFRNGSHELSIEQQCTNPGCQVAQVTKSCTLVPNIQGSSIWNLCRIAFLSPRILRWCLDFWKINVENLLTNSRKLGAQNYSVSQLVSLSSSSDK